MSDTQPRRRWAARSLRLTSVRWRLTLWYVAILGLVVLVFGGIVYTSQERGLRAQQQDELRRQAQQLAGAYRLAGPGADGQIRLDALSPTSTTPTSRQPGAKADQQAIDDAAKKAGIAFIKGDSSDPATPPALDAEDVVVVVNAQGTVTQRFGPLADDEVATRILKLSDIYSPRADDSSFAMALLGGAGVKGDGPIYLFYTTRLLVKNQAFGALILGKPDRAAEQSRRLLLALLLAAPVTLLAAAAGGYWLAARAMRPVRLITRAAQEIGATDLSRRLNLASRDELGDLAATFDRMLDRLEAAFRRQRQFTSDASHELRTPLTIVQLEVERAMAGARTPDEYTRALATIRAENAYMSRLVNDLLLLARADAGRAPLQRQIVDLSDMALEVVERLAPLARQWGIDLQVGALPELPVAGDRLFLTQMLVNVVENALKYTAGHGAWVRVEAGSGQMDGEARGWARVADAGPSIAEEHLPHLFERFYRIDQARARGRGDDDSPVGPPGGSGLGLSVAQWVAQAHGGEIRVESEVGRGAIVEVWLPAALAHADGPERSHSAAAGREDAVVGAARA